MRNGLAILILIAAASAVAQAQTFYPTQDTYLYYDNGGSCTDQWCATHTPVSDYTGAQESANYGNQNKKQGFKGYQNQYIMDYNRSSILSAASTLLGHTATEADFTSGAVTFTLSMMKADGLGVGTDKVWPGYMASTTEAKFGTAGYNNFATYNMAQQTEFTSLSSLPGVPWNGGVNGSFLGDDTTAMHSGHDFPTTAATPSYTRMDCPQYLAGHNYATGVGTYGSGGSAGTGNDFVMWTATGFAYQAIPFPGDIAWHYLSDATFNYLEAYGSPSNSSGILYCMDQGSVAGGTYGGPSVTLALGQVQPKYIHAHPGDVNNDGACNVVDLGVLAKYYDQTGLATSVVDPYGAGSWQKADFNNDGNVNVVDLGVLAKNYDWVGAPAVPTPEPLTLSLLAVGGLALIRRRK